MPPKPIPHAILIEALSFRKPVTFANKSSLRIRDFSTGTQPPENKEKNTQLHSFRDQGQNKKMFTSLFSKNFQFSVPSYETLFKKTSDRSSGSSQKDTFKDLLLYLLSIISFYPLLLEDKDKRGFYLARWARDIWSMMGCKINARYHRYQFTLQVCKATEINTEEHVYNYFANKASIGTTVPGAFIGAGNLLNAGRENNGIANAAILGTVKTINDSENHTIINETLPGHLLHTNDNPGTVTMKFIKKGDNISIEVTGEGYGNFAYLNEILAEPIFKRILQDGIHQYNIIYPAK